MGTFTYPVNDAPAAPWGTPLKHQSSRSLRCLWLHGLVRCGSRHSSRSISRFRVRGLDRGQRASRLPLPLPGCRVGAGRMVEGGGEQEGGWEDGEQEGRAAWSSGRMLSGPVPAVVQTRWTQSLCI